MTAPAAKKATAAHPWPVREQGAVIDAIAEVSGISAERLHLVLNENAEWQPGEPHLEWVMVQDLAAGAAAWQSRHPDGRERVANLFEVLLDQLDERLDGKTQHKYANMMQREGRELLSVAAREVSALCSELNFAFPVSVADVQTLAGIGPLVWVHDWPALAGDTRNDRANKAAELLRRRGVFAIPSHSDAEWTFLLKDAQQGGNVVSLHAVDGEKKAGRSEGSFLMAEARAVLRELADEGRPLSTGAGYLLLYLADATDDAHGQWFGAFDEIGRQVGVSDRTVYNWRQQLIETEIEHGGRSWPIVAPFHYVPGPKGAPRKLDTYQLFWWRYPNAKPGKERPLTLRRRNWAAKNQGRKR